jgi:hypothetical protein
MLMNSNVDSTAVVVTDVLGTRTGLICALSWVQKELTVISFGSTPVPLQVRVNDSPRKMELDVGCTVILGEIIDSKCSAVTDLVPGLKEHLKIVLGLILLSASFDIWIV